MELIRSILQPSSGEVIAMASKFKKNKGNLYAHHTEFAGEVLAVNSKRPTLRNPWRKGNK
jgi:hypothetical protein